MRGRSSKDPFGRLPVLSSITARVLAKLRARGGPIDATRSRDDPLPGTGRTRGVEHATWGGGHATRSPEDAL